ncbi:hypothetical protein RJ640_002624, partial [Escallonia rubra]
MRDGEKDGKERRVARQEWRGLLGAGLPPGGVGDDERRKEGEKGDIVGEGVTTDGGCRSYESVKVKTIYFKSEWESLKETLESIETDFRDIEKHNKELYCAKNTKVLEDLLNKGKKLVQMCSETSSLNLINTYRYSHQLTEYNTALLSFCQVELQLEQSSETKEILIKVNDLLGHAPRGNIGGGFLDSGGDSVFGLDLPLEKLKDLVLLKDSWVVLLSAPSGITNIVQELIQTKGRQQKFEEEHEAMKQLGGFLEKQIKTGPILLVLDDVWPEGEPLIQKFKFKIEGFKILVTSRLVLPSIKKFTYTLDPVILDEWSKGLSILDTSSKLLKTLQTSIDALDEKKGKPHLKNCYLDLGSFPEDQRISAIALHDMWVELYNLDEKDMYTYEYLQLLWMRNLVKFHDLLRELAIYLSNQEPIELRKRVILEITDNKLPKWWVEKEQEPINARLLSISTDEAFSLSLDNIQLPKVEVLILNSRTKNYSLPLFVQKPGQLKVLIIANYGGCPAEVNNFSEVDYLSNLKRIRFEHVSISSLGTSLVKLSKLRKMSLIMCEIGKAFANCINMFPDLVEIEIAYCTDLVEFPVELCNICHLKKLSITKCNELTSLEALGALTTLEVLQLHSCTKLKGLPESIGDLHKLKSLDISDCVSMSEMPLRMGELCNLRTLCMSGCSGLSELPQSVKDLPQPLK